MTHFIPKKKPAKPRQCPHCVLDSVEAYPWELSTLDARPPANLAALVRNLALREDASFFMQKATGRFYPDFVCKLNDDTTLIVEHKGADRWNDARTTG